MTEPYTLTLKDIQDNENLQNAAAMPGDQVINNKLNRIYSDEEDRFDVGYRITEEDINKNQNLKNANVEVGDRVVDNKLIRMKEDDAFKQFLYSFKKPGVGGGDSDLNLLSDIIESKVPLGLTRQDYLMGILNPGTFGNTLSTKIKLNPNHSISSDGLSGVFTANPDAIWGKGFSEANENERRLMIARKYERDLIEEFGYGYQEGDGIANTLGSFTGMISSPTTLLPIGRSAISMTLGSGALSTSYSILEDLAREGEIDPEKAAMYGAFGGLAGFGLNRIGLGVEKYFKNRAIKKNIESEEKMLGDSNKIIDEAETKLATYIEKEGLTPSGALQKVDEELGDILPDAVAVTGRAVKMPRSSSHAKQILRDAAQNDEVILKSKVGIVKQIYQSTLSNINEISPALAGRIRKFEWKLGVNTAKGIDIIRPFVDDLKKLTPDVKATITRHLYNADFDKAIPLMSSSMRTNFNTVVAFLEKLKKEAVDSGVLTETMKNYFPRKVSDYDGLINSFGKQNSNQYQRMLQDFADRQGKSIQALSNSEKAHVANLFARGFRKNIDARPGFSKQRKVDFDTLNDLEIAKFYENAEDSLALYVRNTINNIEKYKLFGRGAKKNKAGYHNIEDSIGSLIAQEQKNIKGQEDRLADLLQSRFIAGEAQMNKTIGQLRDLGYMGTIANPYAAITQFGDLANSGALHGFRNTISALFSEKDLKLIDAGIQNISQDLAEGNVRKTAKALNSLFDITGFRRIDQLGKETLMNAAFKKAVKQVQSKKGEKAFRKEYGELYSFDPKLLDNLINDLKNFKKTGKITDDIKFHGFNELANVQPINLSEMPQGYLNNPNLRLLYALKTFTLKQFDVVRRSVIDEYKKGNKTKAIKNATLLAGYLSTLNIGTKTVKDLIVGRDIDTDNLPKNATFALLGVYGVNEYNIDRLLKDGDVVAAAGRIIAPALTIPEAVVGTGFEYIKAETDDLGMYEPQLEKFLPSIPGVGPLIYNWFGGGAEKYNERLFRESLK